MLSTSTSTSQIKSQSPDEQCDAAELWTVRFLNPGISCHSPLITVVRQAIVLVLSATVLVLVLERSVMAEPTFDYERLDVYRLSIDSVAFSYQIARTLSGVNRQVRDQWLRAAQSIPLNIAEGNGKESLKDKNRFFEVARGSALEFASIHDVLRVCDVIHDDSNRRGKSD